MELITKEKVNQDILAEIAEAKRALKSNFSSVESDAQNRIAISNLYLALVKLNF
jgi:DNA-binding transcriptional regulator/RsmH inhibitor MraZ